MDRESSFIKHEKDMNMPAAVNALRAVEAATRRVMLPEREASVFQEWAGGRDSLDRDASATAAQTDLA